MDREQIELDKTTGWKMLAATFRQMQNPLQLLLIPITFYSGLEQGYFGSEFTRVNIKYYFLHPPLKSEQEIEVFIYSLSSKTIGGCHKIRFIVFFCWGPRRNEDRNFDFAS